MPLDLNDTIVALASPPGPALRGIVRVSGADTAELVSQLFHPDAESATWRSVKHPQRFTGSLILPTIIVPVPAALMYWPTRRSFTGQPMAEFHLSGSVPLVEATLERLCECGARMARRGEFTMRAFLSGRIDLLQAEAVLGVIEATDHAELQQALSQLGGRITTRLQQVRLDLISLLGDLEAGLDFVDEDIEFITKSEIALRLDSTLILLRELASVSVNRLPTGYRRRIVLAGLPNAGKSTLFNRLIGKQRAIVSPIAGTTRDYLTASLQIGSLDVELIDTAGWEDAADLIMERAQELRAEQVTASDLVVWCTAADLPAEMRDEDVRLLEMVAKTCPKLIRIVTRCDLVASVKMEHGSYSSADVTSSLTVSATQGEGLDLLRFTCEQQLLSVPASRGELLGTTIVRCRESLTRAIQSLEQATLATQESSGDELISLEIRQALHELSVVLGEVYTDDILDHIFSSFCIGK